MNINTKININYSSVSININQSNYDDMLAFGINKNMTGREFREFLYCRNGAIDKDSFKISNIIFKNIHSRICQSIKHNYKPQSCINDIECHVLAFACREIYITERNSILDILKNDTELAIPLQNYINFVRANDKSFRELSITETNKKVLCKFIECLDNYLTYLKYIIRFALLSFSPTKPHERLTYTKESDSGES